MHSDGGMKLLKGNGEVLDFKRGPDIFEFIVRCLSKHGMPIARFHCVAGDSLMRGASLFGCRVATREILHGDPCLERHG